MSGCDSMVPVTRRNPMAKQGAAPARWRSPCPVASSLPAFSPDISGGPDAVNSAVPAARACLKIPRGAVFEERAGWRVVPIIGRDEGEHPSWVFDRGATKPAGSLLENPSAAAEALADKPGGGSFVCGPRWLGRHSPLRGCSSLAA